MTRKTARKRSYKRSYRHSTRKQYGVETNEQYRARVALLDNINRIVREELEKTRPQREKAQAEQKRQLELKNKVKRIEELHRNASNLVYWEEYRRSKFQNDESIQALKQKNEEWMKAINETVEPEIQPVLHKFKIEWLKDRIKSIENKITELKKANRQQDIDVIYHLEWLLEHILEYIPTNDPSIKEEVERNKQILEVSKKKKKIIQREKEVIKPLIDKYMNIIQMRFQIAKMNADIIAAKNYPNKIETEKKLVSELESKIDEALHNIKAHPTAASMYSDQLKKEIEKTQLSNHQIRWYQQTEPSKINDINKIKKGYQNRIDFLAQSGGFWPFGPSKEEIAAKEAAEKAIKNAEEAAKAKKIANNAAAEKAKQNAEEAAKAKKIANNAAAEKAKQNAEEAAKAKKIANNAADVQKKEA
jgi:hypothetical protein